MDEPHWKLIWQAVRSQFVLGAKSVHGPSHCCRAEAIALRLAKDSHADPIIVRLFAVLHDAKRESEYADPEHGHRASMLVSDYNGQYFQLDNDRVQILQEAIALHADGHRSKNVTIGTCWDADRLDLARLRIIVRPKYLSTKVASRPELINWAWKLAASDGYGGGGQGRRRR